MHDSYRLLTPGLDRVSITLTRTVLTRLQLSFPLCVFADFPNATESIEDAQGFFSWLHETVIFMRHIPAEQLREGLRFSESDTVVASIQATVLRRPKVQTLLLWRAAYHRIVASLLMDNQESRSLGTIIKVYILNNKYASCLHSSLRQWMYLEGMASTSGEPDIFRLANIGHGYVETVCHCIDLMTRR